MKGVLMSRDAVAMADPAFEIFCLHSDLLRMMSKHDSFCIHSFIDNKICFTLKPSINERMPLKSKVYIFYDLSPI